MPLAHHCLGLAPNAGEPREPTSEGGMWYLRVAPTHRLPGATAFWNAVLPLLTAGMEALMTLPGMEAEVHALLEASGCVCFPHLVSVKDRGGVPAMRPPHSQQELACRMMHRASVILAAGALSFNPLPCLMGTSTALSH